MASIEKTGDQRCEVIYTPERPGLLRGPDGQMIDSVIYKAKAGLEDMCQKAHVIPSVVPTLAVRLKKRAPRAQRH